MYALYLFAKCPTNKEIKEEVLTQYYFIGFIYIKANRRIYKQQTMEFIITNEGAMMVDVNS